MFYVYCLMMMIFIVNSDIGVSASMIFLVVFYLTFIYFTTYNLYRAGRIKDSITDEVLNKAWDEVIANKKKELGDFLDYDETFELLEKYRGMEEKGHT